MEQGIQTIESLPKQRDHVQIKFQESETQDVPAERMDKLEESNNSNQNTSTKEPAKWKEMWEKISEMRKERNAPVDLMGCGTQADPDAEPKVQRFQTLIGVMLSSQTRGIFL
mmetsp:Transcript_29034/g.40860  ORF Transcript_29034/g.40860 Transcript_29034/m.40860 type:complete len:112 (-) Transcript_29034:747-1082(-)